MKDYLEVMQCDECGMTAAYIDESTAALDGWEWRDSGTMCPECVALSLQPDKYSDDSFAILYLDSVMAARLGY